jgi:high-affinity nickel-transport protein
MSFLLKLDSIVIITSIVVAATASAVSERFGAFSRVGGIIGSSVSAAFLLILGLANVYIFYLLWGEMRKVLASNAAEQSEFRIEGGGLLFRLFKKMFRLIDRYRPTL